MKYSEQLKHPLWQRKRLEILERDGYKCRECGLSDLKLHVHHGFYKKGIMAWDYENKHLHTLCEKCHKDYHIFLEKLMELSGEMLPSVIQYLYKILESVNSKAKKEWYDIGDVHCFSDWIIQSIQQLNPISEEEEDCYE